MDPKPQTPICIWCGDGLIPEAHGYQVCSGCGAEFPPPEATNDKMIRDTLHVSLPCARSREVSSGVMYYKAKIGGGGKSGRSRKDKRLQMKKLTTGQINQALVSSKNPKPNKPYEPGEKRKVGRPKKNIDIKFDRP